MQCLFLLYQNIPVKQIVVDKPMPILANSRKLCQPKMDLFFRALRLIPLTITLIIKNITETTKNRANYAVKDNHLYH